MSSTVFRSCGSSENLRTFTSRVLADLTTIRTNLIAAIADRGSAITQIAALVADYAAGRAEIVKLVADYAAGRAQIVKLVTDATMAVAGTFPRTTAGVAIGTSANTAVKNLACAAQIAGVPFAVTAAETAFTATTHDIADGSANSYILSVRVDGTTKTLTMGTAAAGAVPGAAASVPANEVAIGLIVISTTGAIFDASTDALTRSGLTVTYTSYTPTSVFPGSNSLTAAAPAAATAVAPAAATGTAAAAATAATPTAITTVALLEY